MDDGVDVAHGVGDRSGITDVTLEERHVEALQVFTPASPQIVEHPHRVPGVQQLRHEVGADEAATAGDENPTCCPCFRHDYLHPMGHRTAGPLASSIER